MDGGGEPAPWRANARQRNEWISVAEFTLTPDDLKRLARLVEENGLSELRYEQGDVRVTLRTASFRQTPAAPASVMAVPVSAAAGAVVPVTDADAAHDDLHGDDDADADSAESGAGTAAAEGGLRIDAPIMGVFYRRPSPDAPSFVEVGDIVEVGQVIGIIEAMKVFSEVPSEVAGKVVEIPAQHGGLVQPGDPLVILEA